jgi:ABC-type phosphate/phosphonate transport system substrate-binding protein
MRRGKWGRLGGILGVLGLAVALAASGGRADEDAAQPVRIGLIASLFRDMSEPLMQVIMRPFKSLMEAQTGIPGQLVSGGDAQTLGQRLKEGKIHLGVFHGVEFAWARAKVPQLKPLLIAVNQQRYLRANLVVRDDGKIAAVGDLKGQVVALPYLSKEHCWLFLERRCVPSGVKPEKFFVRIASPRDANYAIDDVIDGTAQAAVIDDADLSAYRKQYPQFFAKVKVLQESEQFPCAVIAYYPGTLSEDMIERFRSGMLAAKSSRQGRQMMQMVRISSFEEVPADFDRMLSEIAKAYPPPPAK